jgi:hypothetical protein
MAKTQIDTKTIITVGAVGFGIYVLYKPIKALFDTFGITQSQTAQAVNTLQTSGAKSPFSPLYWRSLKGTVRLLPVAQANAKAKAIQDSIGYFKTKPDFSKILAIFKTLSYKSQVSFLAQQFQALYKQDLLDYLKNGKSAWFVQNALNDTQVQTIIDFVDKLK